MVCDSERRQLKHLIMIAREIYILQKLAKLAENQYTIRMLDLHVNEGAENDPNLLETIYLVTNFEQIDLATLM